MTDKPPVVLATTKSLRTTVDGGMTVTFEIAPQDAAEAFRLFGLTGTNVGIAPITAEAAQKATRESFFIEDLPGEPVDEVKKGRRAFTELSRAQQAGIRCNEPEFWKFLMDMYRFSGCSTPEGAAQCVRKICAVTSRSLFDENEDAARDWDQLEAQYYAWAHGRRK